MPNYSIKLQNLKARRQDTITKTFSLNESFEKGLYGESTTYALEAMEPIDRKYTQGTYDACDRIKNQLKPGLQQYGIDVDFRFQGSVPTDTHIKLYSDIDLLTIHQAFFSLEPPQTPAFPYFGDPLEDLKNLRDKTHRILDTVYYACDIDNSGSKCITISGGSLNRKIDIIASNWYDSLAYSNSGNEIDRGIRILDLHKNQRISNFPFLHISRINEREQRVFGNGKRIVRLLKSLKADAEIKINVSSYDIASLIFRMPDSELYTTVHNRLVLLERANNYLLALVQNESLRSKLNVVNDTRKIFCTEGADITEVSKLQRELQELISAIKGEFRWGATNFDQHLVNY